MSHDATQAPRRTGEPKRWWIAAAITAFVLVVALAVPILNLGGPTDTASGNIAAPTPSPTASASEAICDPLFQQEELENTNNRVDEHFQARIEQAIQAGGSIEDNLRDALLERAGKNGHTLAIFASEFELHEDPNDWDQFVDGTCLSDEGQQLHAQLEGALKTYGTSIALGEAPANGHNSGVSDGVFGVESTPGVGGDRTAVVITMPDGTKVYIMVRCGNIVYEGKPPLPEVPTDNPKCPPGETKNPNGVCVAPKSDDPADYRDPGDGGKGQDVGTGTKPPATETRPVRPTPDPVETSKPGGGGVVDSPTLPEDAESGGTAPGATPPPTTAPTPPPNEGGDFDEGIEDPTW